MTSATGDETPRAQPERRPRRVSRRTLLGVDLLHGPRVVPGTEQEHAPDAWVRWQDPACGTAFSYPSTWQVESRLCPSLAYPHEAFALLSASTLRGQAGHLPDLTRYPKDAALLWLIYYDELLEAAAFQPKLTVSQLSVRASEFVGFMRYGAEFSGPERTFLLRVWVGARASKETRSLLDQSLASLRVS